MMIHPPKLSPQQLHPKELFRTRLVEDLDEGIKHSLTIITAPTGYGKTTLLSQWASRSSTKTAWLSLDKHDNDPGCFFNGFITCLQQISKDIGKDVFQLLSSPDHIPMEKILDRLIKDIGKVSQNFVLVLDDYHLVQAHPVHSMLTYLLEHLPLQMHLFLVSRNDPPFKLSELRSQGKLKEIRQPHLCFTMEEASAFFNNVHKLKIPYGDISAIIVRTKALPAGLKYAALCINHFKTSSEFVSAFENDDRNELTFLVEFLLDKQPEHIRDFIIGTSILEQLSAPLCNTITGRDDCRNLLRTLWNRGLFIQQRDAKGLWYNYHPFLKGLLSPFYQKLGNDVQPNLHFKASLWYAQNGLVKPAFYHSLEAHNFDLAGRQLEKNAVQMLQSGELITVNSWLKEIPEDIGKMRPMLSVCQAWLAIISEKLDTVENHLQNAEAVLDNSDSPEEVKTHIKAIRDFLITKQ